MKKTKDKKSRAKYKCPRELEHIIGLLRLNEEDRRSDFLINFSPEKDKEFLSFAETLHPQIKEYLFFAVEFPDLISTAKTEKEKLEEENYKIWRKCHIAFSRYSDLMTAKSLLDQIAERNKVVSEMEKQYGFKAIGLQVFDEAGKGIVGLYADNRGFLKPLKSNFLLIFEESNVDYKRIRQCEICQNIYWQYRNDSLTCSLECANVLRVRLSRSLTPEQKAERQAKRSANRIYKQNLKKKEKK
ncbi:MAG: hypothetical protein K1X72_10405 [Pyrinomonadaceae bacterium]|nr:hypothetical protein [Pyrinomonadaceae bacterium]